MDYSILTLEDCIRKWEQENLSAIIENGSVIGFMAEPMLSGK